MRRIVTAAALSLPLLLGACASPAAHHPGRTAAPAPSWSDPACPAVLAAAGSIDVASRVTGGEIDSLDGIASPGSTLDGLVTGLKQDLLSILFDQSGLTGNTSADVAKYDSGVAQLKAFCKG